MMADDEMLPGHEEIAEAFDNAEIDTAWMASAPERENESPSSLTGSDLAEFQAWKDTTRRQLEQAGTQAAAEYDHLRALGLGAGSGPTAAVPDLGRGAAAWTFTDLMILARPKDSDGATLDASALPSAWTAVHRNSRDLGTTVRSMGLAAIGSLSGPAKDAYAWAHQPGISLNGSRYFESRISNAADAVDAWSKLVTTSETPTKDALTAAAESALKALQGVRDCHQETLVEITLKSGLEASDLPAPMTDGVIMYVAAVAEELANQFAARCAVPTWGLMFERVSEIPARDVVPSVGSPGYSTSAAQEVRQRADKPIKVLSDRISQVQGQDITEYQAQALVDVVKVTDFKVLSAAWGDWFGQISDLANLDMKVVAASMDVLAYRLERLRSAVNDALVQAPALRDYCLEPIDALVVLIQTQASDAKRVLQR